MPPVASGDQNELIFRFLDAVGDGTGAKSATGDYSSAPTVFLIQPPPKEVYRISRMIVTIEGDLNMRADRYGSLPDALANGITVQVHNGVDVVADLTDGVPITNNAEWARAAFDVDLKNWGPGMGREYLLVRWRFSDAGQFLRLEGRLNESLRVRLNDDFTGLIEHYFMVQGYIEGTAK
jgi:hypothetical protein